MAKLDLAALRGWMRVVGLLVGAGLVVGPVRADEVSALKARLQQLKGTAPLAASVEFENWHSEGADQPKISTTTINAKAEQGADGLKLMYSPSLLSLAASERRMRIEDPEKPTPTKDALEALTPVDVADYFDSASLILNTLKEATLTAEADENLDDQPCHVLTFAVAPRLSANEKRYIKKVSSTFKIWLDHSGFPVATERQTQFSGSFLVLIKFSGENHDEYRYARVGDHLVTTQHAQGNQASGAGEHQSGRQMTKLRFDSAAVVAAN